MLNTLMASLAINTINLITSLRGMHLVTVSRVYIHIFLENLLSALQAEVH